MTVFRPALAFCAIAGAALLASAAGCGASPNSGTFTGSGTGASTGSGSASGGATGSGPSGQSSSSVTFTTTSTGAGTGTASGGPCSGLQCQIHSCVGSGSTTISGTIYDPAGNNPLYGVVAYVPNKKPDPLTSGASCFTCDTLYTGDPIAAAVTDAKGNFTIKNAPDGANIPLVIQVGKWRRQLVIPSVKMCGDTTATLPAGAKLTLPKNGSEGDIPNIAISTGGADTLECLLVRVGLDEAEYVPGASGNGHVHIFQGTGGPNTQPPAPVPEQSLWDSKNDLMKYDILMLSCEGHETDNMNQQALYDYAAAGGRAFASHYHYAWFNTGPFGSQNLATWMPGGNDIGDIQASVVTSTWSGTAFTRGQALHDWLVNVGALQNDLLPISTAKDNATVAMSNTPSQPWLVVQGNPTEPQDFTFDTPLGVPAAQQCGRIAYSDMHVGAASNDYGGGLGHHGTVITPSGCTQGMLSPQEKALEFILFDLSSCVTPNNTVQPPPPVGMPQ